MEFSTFLIILFIALIVLFFFTNLFRILVNFALGILAFLIYFASRIGFALATAFIFLLIYLGYFRGREDEAKSDLVKYTKFILAYFERLYKELLVNQVKNPSPDRSIFFPKEIPVDELKTNKLKKKGEGK